MSATGLGKIFWSSALPFSDPITVPPPARQLYLADRDYTITHIYMSNMSPTAASIDAWLGIKLGGADMFLNDSAKFLKVTLQAGQVFDMSTRIPLRATYGLMGHATASYGDEMVYAGITGEVLD